MITRIAGRDVYVAVISAKRYKNIRTYPLPATWHIPLHMYDIYQAAGAPEVGIGSDISPPDARNKVLDHCAALGVDALILDDDPVSMRRAENGKAVPIDVDELLERLVSTTIEYGGSLGTTSYGFNAFFHGSAPDVQTWGKGVHGAVTYVPQGPAFHLRQDEFLFCTQDFDFALQHALHGTGLVRCEDLMWKFREGDPNSAAAEKDVQWPIENAYTLNKWKMDPIHPVVIRPKGWMHMNKKFDPAAYRALREVVGLR